MPCHLDVRPYTLSSDILNVEITFPNETAIRVYWKLCYCADVLVQFVSNQSKGFKDSISASSQSGNSAKFPSQMLICTPLSPHNILTDPPFFLIMLSTFFPCIRSWIKTFNSPSIIPFIPLQVTCHLPANPYCSSSGLQPFPFPPTPLFF